MLHDFEGRQQRQQMEARQQHGKAKCDRHNTIENGAGVVVVVISSLFQQRQKQKQKQQQTLKKKVNNTNQKKIRKREKIKSDYGTRVLKVIWVRYTRKFYTYGINACIPFFIVQLYARLRISAAVATSVMHCFCVSVCFRCLSLFLHHISMYFNVVHHNVEFPNFQSFE